MKEEIFEKIKGTIIEKILDNLPILFFAKDLENNYLYTNKEIQRMTGFSEEEMLSNNISDLFINGNKYLVDDLRIANSGELERFEESYYDKDGNLRWADTTKFPLKNDKGETVGIVAASVDITNRRKAQLKLEEKHREVEHLRNLIIHDIVNHFQNISNAAELGLIYFERNVGKNLCDEKCGELFKIILKNTQILNGLIEKIKTA